jgi:hypothetical protein
MYDPSATTDQNLLYGLLALQAELITRDQFVQACHEWAEGKEISFPRLLVQRGWLKPEDRREVERLVERKLARHGGDVRACLAELASNPLQKAFIAIQRQREAPHGGVSLGVSAAAQNKNGAVPQSTSRDASENWQGHEASADYEHGTDWDQPPSRRPQAAFRSVAMIVVAILAVVALAVLVLPLLPQLKGKNGGGLFGPGAQRARNNDFAAQGNQIHELVEGLYLILVAKEDVLEAIKRDPTLSEDDRDRATRLAERYPEQPMLLNNASWFVLRRSGGNPDTYRRALHLAEVAAGLQPQDGFILNTLGVAQYRVGKFQEAVDTLTKSDRINSRQRGQSISADLAFLAMASHRLGQKERANSYLERLRRAVKDETDQQPQESEAFLKEAETLIEGKPVEPPGRRPGSKTKSRKDEITT